MTYGITTSSYSRPERRTRIWICDRVPGMLSGSDCGSRNAKLCLTIDREASFSTHGKRVSCRRLVSGASVMRICGNMGVYPSPVPCTICSRLARSNATSSMIMGCDPWGRLGRAGTWNAALGERQEPSAEVLVRRRVLLCGSAGSAAAVAEFGMAQRRTECHVRRVT